MKRILLFAACIVAQMILLSSCLGRQTRLLNKAESLALDYPDSAAALLAQVDTLRLMKTERPLYDLTRALIYEEEWQRRYADTASCLTATETDWTFRREMAYDIAHPFATDVALYRAYLFYERACFGGTVGGELKPLTPKDKTALRRFGRLCYALSRHFNDNDTLLQADQLFHLAIHCAEATADHATAYRAYDKLGLHASYSHNDVNTQLWAVHKSLEHYRHQQNDAVPWLLMLVNDYGKAFLNSSFCNLKYFPTLVRAATSAVHGDTNDVFERLDSVWADPAQLFFTYPHFYSSGGQTDESGKWWYLDEVSVYIPMYEEAKEKADHRDYTLNPTYKGEYYNAISNAQRGFHIKERTYLAPGYVLKTAILQKRLLVAVIIILVLLVLLSVLLLRQMQQKHRAEREREAERRTEETRRVEEERLRTESMLRQKDTMIATLRGHLIDKSEIMEMLEPKAGKRTLITAQNWREIEMTLDTADNFVNRLRSEHPDFSEDDIRLCMLTRLRLSNTALSAIYVISISAVQHRKQKLKKEGFGVTDPTVTLDQIIANY